MLLNKKEYDNIFSKVIRCCVDLYIPTPKGSIFGQRSHEPFKGMYALPGGRINFGESIGECIKRIGSNELSLIITDYKLISFCEWPDEIESANRHSISLVFKCRALGKPILNHDVFSTIKYSKYLDKNLVVKQHQQFLY